MRRPTAAKPRPAWLVAHPGLTEGGRYVAVRSVGSGRYDVCDRQATHPYREVICTVPDLPTAERLARALQVVENLGLEDK